jgi:hypothetical protein
VTLPGHSGARPQARLRASSTRYGREPGIQGCWLGASLFVKPVVTPPCGRLSAFGAFKMYFCQSRATAIECSRFNDEESALA